RLRDEFWESFDPADKRTELIVREYVNNAGDTINLLPPADNVRPFKYWPGGDFAGPAYGNDIPVIRYSDILLSRAEALNELNGPTQEALDLINLVRQRAEVPNLELSNFADQAALRDHILAERGWEFWYEEKRRDDLVRHGKLISLAQDRGQPAQPHHVRYPIPQFALDANPLLVQNEGY
ncbi:MAG: RagB/SusD family nutrient uptake outer membrane protein, partial [Bacteroidota bacterium]